MKKLKANYSVLYSKKHLPNLICFSTFKTVYSLLESTTFPRLHHFSKFLRRLAKSSILHGNKKLFAVF